MKHKFSYIGIVLAVSICLLALGILNVYTRTSPLSKITVMAAGVPDSYGSRIDQFTVFQNTTGTWTDVTHVVYTTFTNGTTLSMPANQKTILEVIVWLNSTLAPDLSTAATRTRIYITISGVTTATLMTYSHGSVIPLSGMWWLTYYYPSKLTTPTSVWTPATDTTYTVTLQYQAYY